MPVKLKNAVLLFPADLWFEVIDYLRVTDIVHLRAVSRNFYRIISSPVIWKRLLRKIGAPLPIQAATIASLSAKETEKVIKRALCLDINWRRVSPTAHAETLRSVERPYMVRILPGGKYLVAATKSAEDQSAAVVVWDLENPEERGGNSMLLAKCRTRTNISQLVVRYMHHKGKPGIAIATLRAIGEKPAQKTEVCVIHISLEALEKLSLNQDPGGPPFDLVELHKTRCQVAFLTLEGKLLSVVHRPRTLMFLDLETKDSSQLKLPHSHDGQRHSIQGCKLLPFQNQVFVIRLIYSEERTSYAFELYDIPAWDTVAKEPPPVSQHMFEEAQASSFVISEGLARQPNSDHPSIKDKIENNNYFAPISIFAHTVRPKGIIHWQIDPVSVPTHPRTIHGSSGAMIPNVIGQNPAFPALPHDPESEEPAPAPAPAPTPIMQLPVNPTIGFPFFPGPMFHIAGVPNHFLNPPSLPPAPADLDVAMATDSVEPVEPRLQYVLPAKRMAHYWFEDNDQKPTVLPGADRSVFWTRPMETRADYPPMRNLLAYTTKAPAPYSTVAPSVSNSRDDGVTWGFHPGSTTTINAQNGTNLPDKRLKHLRLTPGFIEAVQSGTQNAAFDEGSGKLCLAAGKPTDLYLLDYATL